MYEVVSELGKSVLACTDNTLEVYKRFGRIRQEYFADRHKIKPISIIFVENQKNQILNHLQRHDQMGKKTYHVTIPLNESRKEY
jgi:hypothetical protein